jgi:hypothetical protein
LAEKDFLLETLQVLCSRNSLFQDVSCGELEIKYYLSQHESDVSAGDNKKQCQGTRIVRGSCPNECHLMMSEAKDALGCCIGSQQDFAVANSISDGTDVLANHTYWNRHHCSIRVPDRCSATVISQFREVSDHCKQQLKSLDVPHSCDVDWHALQAVIKLDSFAALSVSICMVACVLAYVLLVCDLITHWPIYCRLHVRHLGGVYLGQNITYDLWETSLIKFVQTSVLII